VSSYRELIKNFERVRSYIRDFYLYGFKSREDYRKKSARSYDDERRRVESWLGEDMDFVRTPEGKNVFISVDSRRVRHNPFYRAWKTKSFTDGDVTLHFILFDILFSPEVRLTLSEILERIDGHYLAGFEEPMSFDESTVRKKLKEYAGEGIVVAEKEGRRVLYRRAEDTALSGLADALGFFSEAAPCGVIGSYILDKCTEPSRLFAFKHHYMTGAMDSGVLASLFDAMREKCAVSVTNLSRRRDEPRRLRLVPLRILVSVQNGRQHLLAYHPETDAVKSFRLDYLSDVRREEQTPRFDELRAMLDGMQEKMWGVNVKQRRVGEAQTEHVEFTVRVGEDEAHIVRRLEREKRVGRVERIGAHTYRFTADVYDTGEMIPWIRTFICRIVSLHFSNRAAEKRLRDDLEATYRLYGIEKEVPYDIQ